jgi:hypothetical protein
MNALYFATGCILIILVIYWGSDQIEPPWLSRLFGRATEQPPEAIALAAKKKKQRRW